MTVEHCTGAFAIGAVVALIFLAVAFKGSINY